MTMFDNSPERRNLSVLAIGIILYNLAGGHVVGSSLELQLMNVKFDKLDVLGFSLILFLLWFLFRYWVVNKVEANTKINEIFFTTTVTRLYRIFVDNSVVGSVIMGRDLKGDYHFSVKEQERKKMSGFGEHLVWTISYSKKLFTEEIMTGYFFPYFLALGALYFIFNFWVWLIFSAWVIKRI